MGILISSQVEVACGTPGCRDRRGYGLFASFCNPCADRLAKLRDEIEQEVAAANPKTRSRGGSPMCCSPYCYGPRRPPALFCEDCQDAGYVEEAA